MKENKKFIVTCDSACDMPKEFIDSLGAYVIPFEYTGKVGDDVELYTDTMNANDYKEFYNQMRKGTVFKTSQINVDRYLEFFTSLKNLNLPILHISLCNALSNTIENAQYVAKELAKDGMEIHVVDSKIASLGIGLLVCKACKLRDEGKDINEAENAIIYTSDHLGVYYTTNTLTYFARGGRLSKTTSLIASLLSINVILDCDKNGALRTIQKCHGRNKAKQYILKHIKENALDPKNQVIYVCASDCKDESVQYAAELVKEVGFKYYCMTDMGPIIGAHTGPGLIAVFYETKENVR